MHLLTPFQAKYYAYDLTRQRPSGDLGKLTASLQDAQVDLNPHQVDAALFAFKSPLSKGAILADEVGLGKTIEAGIILAQKWAERKRKLLVVCPANLRKQWSQELQDKFYLPSVILEKKSFDATISTGNLNPFLRTDEIIICSYQFIKSKEPYVRQTNWDLVIIDEAHRLRNVYKPNNKIANTIKNALYHSPKVLLTTTPLQNTLLELYGLVSIIDEFAFGDLKSYKTQFSKLTENDNFTDLQQRLALVCKRTLRRQVQEYINYTNRIPIVEEFFPYEKEIELYNGVTEYLQKPVLYALPARQRQLITLILRKLLSSSTYAISGTMNTMKLRLEGLLKKQEQFDQPFEEAINTNYDDFTDLKDEWEDDEEDIEDSMVKEDEPLTPEQIVQVQEEINLLHYFKQLAESVKNNSKGEKLITALQKGFEKLHELGALQKAIIFTASTRTQTYIKELLEAVGYKGKLVLFNGSNNDPDSKAIYQRWIKKHSGTDKITGSPTSDKRQKQQAQNNFDAKKLLIDSISTVGKMEGVTKIDDLLKPAIKKEVLQRIEKVLSTGQQNLFKDKIMQEAVMEYGNVLTSYREQVIEIPRIDLVQDAISTWFEDFDLDTTIGFDLRVLKEEIQIHDLHSQKKTRIGVHHGAQFRDKPVNLVISELINFPEVDYDQCAALLHKLAMQALNKLSEQLGNDSELPTLVRQSKKLIASRIWEQMRKHFRRSSPNYSQPSILPFTEIVPWSFSALTLNGFKDYRATIIPTSHVPRFVFIGFTKACHPQYKFDSKSEKDFAQILEQDKEVIKWMRPADKQFRIYYANNARQHHPDFVVETNDTIYLAEVKAKDEINTPEVQDKKQAAEMYCRYASEYTTANGGKLWKYILVPHDVVMLNNSFFKLKNESH